MELTILQLWRLSIVGPIFIRFMWSGVCCMTTAVVRVKSKPPSTRSTVLIYLYIFCKNWFGTIELILDSIIDNDNWWEHVRGVCYYDCPQICWLLVSTSLNPSKKPRQDITMPAGTGSNIIISHNFLISLFWDYLLCLCAQNRMYLKTLHCDAQNCLRPKFFVILLNGIHPWSGECGICFVRLMIKCMMTLDWTLHCSRWSALDQKIKLNTSRFSDFSDFYISLIACLYFLWWLIFHVLHQISC